MVEAGKANVQQDAALDVQLVVEVVQLLGDVVAEHDGEQAAHVTLLGHEREEAAAAP